MEWYRKAAQSGLASACRSLALHLELGKGCAREEKEALALYRKAQEGGEDCAADIRRLTTERRSTRIAYCVMLAFTLLTAAVCSIQYFGGTTQSGILALAGAVGAALCGRMVWRLRPLESKQQP